MAYSTLELCSGGGAFEAVPAPRLKLDLHEIRLKLEREGIEVVDARVMLIARTRPEVTISRDGRIMLKTHERSEAEGMLRRILDISGIASPRASERPRG